MYSKYIDYIHTLVEDGHINQQKIEQQGEKILEDLLTENDLNNIISEQTRYSEMEVILVLLSALMAVYKLAGLNIEKHMIELFMIYIDNNMPTESQIN